MKLKVCGMREMTNIMDLVDLKPDFIGFIFYPKSPRYVGVHELPVIPDSIIKVGVFVNETEEQILDCVQKHALDFVQLHGDETVALAQNFKKRGVGVIKVLSVMDEMPNDKIETFESTVDYFLFDTKTPAYGGSGNKFDWEILKQYDSEVPFFLSGGIDVEDIEIIKNLGLEKLEVIDVNSRFEVSPGLKDIEKLKKLKSVL